MHGKLKEVFDKTVEIFRDDPRVIGAWIIGSARAKSEDVYSDVDPMFIVKDEYFNQFDAELRSVFEGIVPEIILWWPERGNNDLIKNYAILFNMPPLLQYDINFMKESAFSSGWLLGRTPDQILFDKTGLLAEGLKHVPKPSYTPDVLRYKIELFWIYAYIMVKYLLRRQTFKIIYTQQIFFESHLEVLHALQPDVIWDWWPINVHKLFEEEKQNELHRYFAASDADSVKKLLLAEIDSFSADAKSACTKWNVEYPQKLENDILEFIKSSGCLDKK